VLELALRMEAEGLRDRERGARARRRQDDRREPARLDLRLREHALHHLGQGAAVAELRLKGAGEAARELLLAGAPRAEELLGHGVRRDDLRPPRLVAEEDRRPRAAAA